MKEFRVFVFKNKITAISQQSLFLKHIEIFKKVQELDNNSEEKNAVIVIEDDAVFKDNYEERLNEYLKKLPEKWDIIFLGDCCDIHASNITLNKYFYESKGSRGTGFYILNINSAKRLLNIYNEMNQIDCPIDHWFNKIQSTNNLCYYFAEPTLAEQGSGNGLFKTSIEMYR